MHRVLDVFAHEVALHFNATLPFGESRVSGPVRGLCCAVTFAFFKTLPGPQARPSRKREGGVTGGCE